MNSTRQRRSRSAATIAGVGITALLLAGCTTSEPTDDESGAAGGVVDTTITVAEVNELTSLNTNTPDGNLDINGKVSYLTRSGFNYLSDELEIVPNETFGTVNVESEDPLVVTYTINEGQQWSDGEPITADDLLLNWAVQSAYYDDATYSEEDGSVTGGNAYFTYAGDTSGLALTEFPEISEDNLSLTLNYSEPFADWALVDLLDRPAHVVAEKAGTTLEELRTTLEETPRGDPESPAEENATLRSVADFWNTGFDMSEFPTDEDLLVSSGPFILTAWEPEQSITLELNENYTAGLDPQFTTLVIRFIGDANAQVTALQNGEADIIAPQASADTLSSLEAIDTATTIVGDQFSYDHIDLTFNEGPFEDPTVREAFLKTIPRQQILDAIVTPINPEAKILDSQLFVPTQGDPYDQAVAGNGSEDFAEPDIDGAKELLDGATPTVSILYNSENPNRVDAFEAIAASAEEAGFKVEDQGSPDWGELLGGGGYDASIFGWVSSGVGVTGVPQIFGSTGGGNYNGYANDTVDELNDELVVTADTEEQVAIQLQIENELWADFYGLPLFQGPGITAFADTVDGVTHYPGQTGVFWNVWEWTAAE
jgi:peptide/nickel transport system substrate-binding protein